MDTIRLDSVELEILPTTGGDVQRTAGLVWGAGISPIHGVISSAFDESAQPILGEEILKKLYVGNLPFSATEEVVKEMFGKHGNVQSVALINDRETGRPRGFGFVELDDDAATAAISALNGFEMDGRALKVNEAQDRPKGGGGGGGGGGGRW